MKQFLLNLIKKASFKKILIIALLVRLILAPLNFHSDLTTNAIWGRYARDFGLTGYYDWLNFSNFAIPEYPPISTFIFLGTRYLWEGLFSIFWKINISLPAFPSSFIPWFEDCGYKMLFKIPGILGDLGVGILMYKLTKNKGIAKAKVFSILYLFNPAIIRLSSTWGQTESFLGFFALLSLILLERKRIATSALSMFISLMTKATMIPIIPIYVIYAIKKGITLKSIVISIVVLIGAMYLVGIPFSDNSIFWLIDKYRTKFLFGPGNLPFVTLNSFNFWGVLFGLKRFSDSVVYFGITLKTWGYILTTIFTSFIVYRFVFKKANVYFALVLITMTTFLFLPRMHERYLYPIFVFFPILLSKFPKLKKMFIVLSIVFFINLYHWWYVPSVPILPAVFDLELVERGLSLVNVIIFGKLIWNYQLS